jgi:hypothetical protein
MPHSVAAFTLHTASARRRNFPFYPIRKRLCFRLVRNFCFMHSSSGPNLGGHKTTGIELTQHDKLGLSFAKSSRRSMATNGIRRR